MTVIDFVAAVAIAVFIGLLVAEARGWLPHLCRIMARRAARRLPASEREDSLAEYLADLDRLEDRPLSSLVWALGLFRAASRRRRDSNLPPWTAQTLVGSPPPGRLSNPWLLRARRMGFISLIAWPACVVLGGVVVVITQPLTWSTIGGAIALIVIGGVLASVVSDLPFFRNRYWDYWPW